MKWPYIQTILLIKLILSAAIYLITISEMTLYPRPCVGMKYFYHPQIIGASFTKPNSLFPDPAQNTHMIHNGKGADGEPFPKGETQRTPFIVAAARRFARGRHRGRRFDRAQGQSRQSREADRSRGERDGSTKQRVKRRIGAEWAQRCGRLAARRCRRLRSCSSSAAARRWR